MIRRFCLFRRINLYKTNHARRKFTFICKITPRVIFPYLLCSKFLPYIRQALHKYIDTGFKNVKKKISSKLYSSNRTLDDTLYRSSFLRLLLRSIVLDKCIHVKCDEKLSKIVAGVNSQKKLRESRYRSKSVSLRISTANFRIVFYHPVSLVLKAYLITTNPNLYYSI